MWTLKMGLSSKCSRIFLRARRWPEHGVVLWRLTAIALLLYADSTAAAGAGDPMATPGPSTGDWHGSPAPATGPDPADFGNSQADHFTSSHLNHSDGNNSAHNDTEGEDHEEKRFHVAMFDFDRVSTPLVVSMWVVFATLAKIVFHLRNKLSSLFPESCLLIMVGVVLGLILYFAKVSGYEMDTDTFFFYLLPPIILEAGYFMPNRAFFDNIGTILLFAVVGTLANTFLIGMTLWGFSAVGGAGPTTIGPLPCLTFATLLSAVDPVAVLAVFEEIHVNEVLHIVVFGESLLNDGVTVVLYHMFEGYTEIGQGHITGMDIAAGVGSFFVVAGCGTLVGIVFGLLTSFFTRLTDHVPVIQPLFVFIMGYLSYVFAEMFHLSGILACTFCGITMKKYVEANISKKSHTTTKYFMKMLASVCETIIFMYLGISTVVDSHQWETGFVLVTLIACLVYRALGVVVLTYLANRVRLVKISKVDQFIMAYGGLRGAIAFSLVVLLDEAHFPHRNLFITTTVVVVYFTNFIQGSTIKPLVDVLRVKKADKHKPSMNEQINCRFIDHLMAGIEDITGHHGHHKLRERYEFLDNKYLKPLLIRKNANKYRGVSIVNVFQKLNERDATEMVQNSSGLVSQMHLDPSMVRNWSFMRILASLGSTPGAPNGYSSSWSSPLCAAGEQTQVDLQAQEAQDTRKMRDDSKVHHIFEDAMFIPRKRFVRHRRHMLPPEADNNQTFHHKAKLNLRHLVSHHHRHSNESQHNGTVHGNGNGRPRKNVSFAEVAEVSNEADTDVGSMRAESGGGNSDSGSELGGITFTVATGVTGNFDEDLSDTPSIPMEPVAVEKSLPWKRTTGREAMSSSMTHSMPDDHHPLLGEAPSWVNNTEYTSPGSPPNSPPTPRAPRPAPPPETGPPHAVSTVKPQMLGFENPAMERSLNSDGPDAPLLGYHEAPDVACHSLVSASSPLLATQSHSHPDLLQLEPLVPSPAQLPPNPPRAMDPHQEDDNHDRTGGTASGIPAAASEALVVAGLPAPWRAQEVGRAVEAPHSHYSPVQETSAPVSASLPWRDSPCSTPDTHPELALAWGAAAAQGTTSHPPAQDLAHSLPWRRVDSSSPETEAQLAPAQPSLGSSPPSMADPTLPRHRLDQQHSSESLPWRTDPQTSPESLPWRTETQSHPTPNPQPESLPWRTSSAPNPDPQPEHSLPWRTDSVPAPSLPWHSAEAPLESTDRVDSSAYPTQNSPVSPLPWRCADTEVATSSPSPDPQNGSPTEGDTTSLPPPWRTCSDCPPPEGGLPLPWRCQSEVGMEELASLPPPPWRSNGETEPRPDQGAPRPPVCAAPPPHEEAHIPPPPWRHQGDPPSSVRSPSASCEVDAYSLRPQQSSHSFRISEAESKHSEPVHVHHMIDLPHGRPVFELGPTDSDQDSLDLDSPQQDSYDRVMAWLLTCDTPPPPSDDGESSHISPLAAPTTTNGFPADHDGAPHPSKGITKHLPKLHLADRPHDHSSHGNGPHCSVSQHSEVVEEESAL